jgi:hypothetical protein
MGSIQIKNLKSKLIMTENKSFIAPVPGKENSPRSRFTLPSVLPVSG